ncbi:endonuclease domain-containing protein [Microbacterium caowuchunii]|uniref:DUF559 domain-containing protein n=1 Tax=Microbacterium caowuchunii TaxID=2614638 RepID=A0A5N0THF4_9MICO|nr:DUF559 domain-containing protein [Microbacterium caowuchunii]KAA9134603.1 DUF559 domain-containing protein [Microbacterium caowuchunii]
MRTSQADRSSRMLAFVRTEGGVVRSGRLRELGFAVSAVTDAVACGELVRIRRRWVAVPDADPHLRAAAKSGVVVSCITQAARLGLWTFDEPVPHVAAPPHAGRILVADGTRVHRAIPLVPRHPDALDDPVENVLALVAACRPREAALVVFESALRMQMIDVEAFARLPLTAAARSVLEAASPFSDSGLETLVVPRLRWLRLRIVPQAWIAGHRVDFLIGDRLVLQIDGGHHVGAQREADIRHDARLTLMGFHVLRIGYAQVVHDWPSVQHDIMRAVAQGLHRSR